MATPTLLGYLATQFISPISRKSWFSGEYVRLGEYMQRAQFLFETGAILGYSFRDHLPGLVELWASPDPEEKPSTTALTELAASQMIPTGAEPRDLLDVFFKPEAERIMQLLREARATRRSGWKEFPRVARKRMPVEGMLASTGIAIRKGIAFGSHFPELTERMLARPADPESWAALRGKSADFPASPPEPLPLSQRQREANSLILPYIETIRPDLLARLGLWPENGRDVRLRLRALRARRMPMNEPEE